jgi:hypothetical protein
MFTLILIETRGFETFGQFDTLGLAQDYLRSEGYRENRALRNIWDGFVRVKIAQIKALEKMPRKSHKS